MPARLMQNRRPTAPNGGAPLPAFDPVPRKCARHDGWTPERQRAFIEALADTGSVSRAAAQVNMSSEGAYYLRRQPGATSFRAAWEAALDYGVARMKDIAFERAITGYLVPVITGRAWASKSQHHRSGKVTRGAHFGAPLISISRRQKVADVRVKCINKQPRNDPYNGITHLAGDGWKWTRQQVVDSIRAKTNTFFTLVNGNRGNIAVIDGPNGPYLRTYADGKWNDNLLSLPECT